MDTVTYPNEMVTSLIEKSFVAFKVNMLERHPDFKEASAGRKVIWAPTIIFADDRGRETRRFTGWLPPESFIAELELVRGFRLVNRNRFEEARGVFGSVITDYPDSPAAPEALYWHGIVGFLGGDRDMNSLQESWTQIPEKHPGTRWASHASVIEDWQAS